MDAASSSTFDVVMDTFKAGSYAPHRLRELCAKIQEAADETASENAHLTARVRNLEIELDVWKKAVVTNHNQETSAITGASAGIADREKPRLALCIIDGTRTMFSARYFHDGIAGGLQAAEDLIHILRQSVAGGDSFYDEKSYSLWIYIYLNKANLAGSILAENLSGSDQLDCFFIGLSKASPMLIVIDTADKDDADKKIRANLRTFSALPQTTHVFFKGGYASEFASILHLLQQSQVDQKLKFLHDRGDIKPATMPLDVPVILTDNLFIKSHFLKPRMTLSVSEDMDVSSLSSSFPPTPPSLTLLGSSLASPQATAFSEYEPTGSDELSAETHIIDPNLPLFKQSPPPCNEFYLMDRRCSHGERCRYSHKYNLTPDQLRQLADNAKKSPCFFVNSGKECPYGVLCCWGHVCPFGTYCRYLSRNQCRFQGAGMHSPQDLAEGI